MKKYLIAIFVILVAFTVAYFDFGIIGTAVSFAALPLIPLDFDGDDNLPGVARAYVILVDDLEVEAKPVSNPATALAALQIVGNHIPKTAKYWIKMYSTQGKGTLSFTAEGGRDFENFSIAGLLFHPSTKDDALALASALLGRDLIILIEENSESANFKQVGTVKLPARLVSSGDWGTELNGEKGITFTIQAFHGKKTPYLYAGTIPLAADEIVS